MYAYRNNGLSMRAVDTSITPLPDEIVFPDYATDQQLAAAFPNRAAALAQLATDAGAAQDAQNTAVIVSNPRMAKVVLTLANQIRTMQNKQPLTPDQLLAWIQSL